MIEEIKNVSSLLRIWHRKYIYHIISILILSIISAFFTFAESACVQKITSQLVKPEFQNSTLFQFLSKYIPWLNKEVRLLVIFFIFIEIVIALLSYYQHYVLSVLHIRSVADLENSLLGNLINQKENFFRTISYAEIINRVNTDIARIVGRRKSMATIILQSCFVSGYIIYFSMSSIWLTIVILFAALASILATLQITSRAKNADREFLHSDDSVKKDIEDYVRLHSDIVIGGKQHSIFRKFHKRQDIRRVNFLKYSNLEGFLLPISTLGYMLAFGCMVFILTFDTSIDSNVDVSLVPVMIMVLPQIFQRTRFIVLHAFEISRSESSVLRLLQFATNHDWEFDSEVPQKPGQLRLENLSFAIINGNEVSVDLIRDVKLVFEPRKFVTIVGTAGSGKSTLINLVLGRLVQTEGKILFNGQETNFENRSSIFGYMTQSTSCFDGSIAENLDISTDPNTEHSELFSRAEYSLRDSGLIHVLIDKGLSMYPKMLNLEGLEDLRMQINTVLNRRFYQNDSSYLDTDSHGIFSKITSSLNLDLTWEDNLLTSVNTHSLDSEIIRDSILECMESYPSIEKEIAISGLNYSIGREGTKLSGGQRQLVAFCRTILTERPVLVFDEPTSALDPSHKSLLIKTLQKHSKSKLVIVITHDKEVAFSSDKIVLLDSGQVKAVLDGNEFARKYPGFFD